MTQLHRSVFFLVLFVTIRSHVCGEEIELRKVTIGDDVTLSYVERGEGEPVIFIHGLTGDYSVWLPQVEAFATEHYRAISYSRRYNFPNANEIRFDHSATTEADDLALFIRKLGLKNAHIVGHSFGAYTALMLALKHPELVRTLTLAEPPLAPWLSSLPGEQAKAGKEHSKRLLTKGVIPARAAFEAGNEELAMQTMIDAISGEGTFARIPADAKTRLRRNVNEMKAAMMSKNAYPYIARERVGRLTIPTLLLSGGKSVATAKVTAPELERLLPNSSRKRVVLPEASHMMWSDEPQRCRDVVLEFIGGK